MIVGGRRRPVVFGAPLHKRTAVAVLAAAVLVGGCTRGANEVETGAAAPVATAGGAATAAADTLGGNGTQVPNEQTTAAGDFGDLKGVCGPGDASGATAQGVTDDAIQVGTIADPGFVGRPGLNQEIFDSAEVFTAWCNDAGGINGRKIEDVERDAKLTEYKQRITESCQEDFMLVGSGGVFDETGQEERLRCMLPEIPGFQVSPEARASELSVSPVPAAIDELQVGLFRYLEDEFPGSTDRVGFLTGNIGSLVFVDAQAQDAAKQLGWTSVYKAQYNSTGEASWTPFAEALSSDKVEGVVYTGEPEGLAKLLQAMADIGYEPKWILAGTNVIDQGFIDVGGAAVKNVYAVASVVPPFLAEDNPATQQYLDLFGEFLPDGKDEALLGYQAFSGWLLFAGAVKQCGSDVTRTCVYDAARKVTDWTGGGLHAEANPSKDQGPECMMVVEATPKGFVIPDDFEPNDGLFSCSKDNIIKLTGDYGSGTTLESVGKSIDDLE
ncbi:MAG: ABC transporter substrate-binding protein [Candidatus Microthrix sp.]|nr:ABC transporter substrate-binding protein [Candidatus Microthrix sp.]